MNNNTSEQAVGSVKMWLFSGLVGVCAYLIIDVLNDIKDRQEKIEEKIEIIYSKLEAINGRAVENKVEIDILKLQLGKVQDKIYASGYPGNRTPAPKPVINTALIIKSNREDEEKYLAGLIKVFPGLEN